MHAVVPFGDCDSETFQTQQRLLADVRLTPHMRPRWLKVDPHRAQISNEFMIWCEWWSIEVVDFAGKSEGTTGQS